MVLSYYTIFYIEKAMVFIFFLNFDWFFVGYHSSKIWDTIHSQPDQENPAADRSEGMATPFYNINISSAMGAHSFNIALMALD